MKNFLTMVALIGLAILGLSQPSANAQDLAQDSEHATVPQWISPQTSGELSGRLILPLIDGTSEPIARAAVVMTNSEGQTLRSRTDEAGHFIVKGVQPGIYALTARGKGTFACCAMHVVDSTMASADLLPSEAEVAAAGIDFTVLKTSILRYLPPFTKMKSPTIAEADLKAISERVAGENMFRVAQSDGGLKGRLHVAGAVGSVMDDAGFLNVFLIQAGEIVDRVVSERDGTFRFADRAPGAYSILALGQAGLGMAGFELVDESAVNRASLSLRDEADTQPNKTTFVAAVDATPCCCCTEFSMQIAPLPMAIQAFDDVTLNDSRTNGEGIAMEPVPGAVDQFGNPIGGVDQFGNPIGGFDQFGNPIGGSGFGGGGFAGGGYGGGFGGGGGGFGGIGGLAALGGLAAIAASDRNRHNDPIIVPARPASPVRSTP